MRELAHRLGIQEGLVRRIAAKWVNLGVVREVSTSGSAYFEVVADYGYVDEGDAGGSGDGGGAASAGSANQIDGGDEDEDEGDDDDGVLDKYEIPEGFVHVPKPAALPEGDAEEDGKITNLFVLIMWEARVRGNDIWAWYLGKVMKFNKRRKHNYRIMWEDDGGIDQKLRSLDFRNGTESLFAPSS